MYKLYKEELGMFYINDYLSFKLDDAITEIYERFQKIFEKPGPVFFEFRRFLDLYGLRFDTVETDNRRYTIRLLNKTSSDEIDKLITDFGRIFMNGISENGKPIISFTFGKNIIPDDMEDRIVELTTSCSNEFVEHKERSKNGKIKFGNVSNDILRQLDATEEEVAAYWKYIREKRFLTPMQYMGYIRTLDKIVNSKDTALELYTRISDVQSSKTITEVDDYLSTRGYGFLPKNNEICENLLASYLKTRYNVETHNDERFSEEKETIHSV